MKAYGIILVGHTHCITGYTILITVVPREHYLPKPMLNSLIKSLH